MENQSSHVNTMFFRKKKIYCYFQMADGLDDKKKIKVQKHQKSYQTKVS